MRKEDERLKLERDKLQFAYFKIMERAYERLERKTLQQISFSLVWGFW